MASPLLATRHMETFSFGVPPEGVSLILSNATEPMPEPFRSAIAAHYKKDNADACILAAVDRDLGLAGLYQATAQDWIEVSRVKEVVLQPTLPAKGSGLIEIFWEADREMYPGGCLHAHGYTASLHRWLAERGRKLATMIGCGYREADTLTDC